MNIYPNLLYILLTFIIYSCLFKNEKYEISVKSNDGFIIVGQKKIDNIIYHTIFTTNNLDSSCVDYLDYLMMESSRQNRIAFFYKQLDSTPKGINLEDLDEMFNNSFIGGIEKNQDGYFKLIFDKKKLVRKSELIKYMQ